MNESIQILDTFDFFSSEEDYAIFIGQKGETRKRQTETELPWDFDLNFKCIVSAGMEKRIFFYTTNENVVSIFKLTVDEESIENLFVTDLSAVGLNDFRINTANIAADASVFISGHIVVSGGTNHYFLHFSSDGILKYKQKQYQSSDNHSLGHIVFAYAFSVKTDTAFIWCKDQNEVCRYNPTKNRCKPLFDENSVYTISAENDWLLVLTPNELIKAPVSALYERRRFALKLDCPYPPFKVAYANNRIVMIQPYESRFTDNEASVFEYYHGGIFSNVLQGNAFVPDTRYFFKKDEWFENTAIHAGTVAFDDYHEYVQLLEVTTGNIKKIVVRDVAKNCNFLHLSGNYLYVGNWSGLVKMQFTDYKTRIEKILEIFAAKNRMPWKVDYKPLAIDLFEAQTKSFFTNYFDAKYVATNFALPEDFGTFLSLCPAPYQIPFAWEVLYDAQHILKDLPEYYHVFEEDFERRKTANELTATDKMWLRFALYGDKHEFLICCDRTSAAFGKVFDAYDDHPWMDESYIDINQPKYDSFIDFLENTYAY